MDVYYLMVLLKMVSLVGIFIEDVFCTGFLYYEISKLGSVYISWFSHGTKTSDSRTVIVGVYNRMYLYKHVPIIKGIFIKASSLIERGD